MTIRKSNVLHDTEDRNWWYQHGENLEKSFVEICRKKFGLDAQINPEKQQNKYAPDLIINDIVCDLKTQNTPFYTASRYKIDPRYAVTFNRKDYERYKEFYPKISIYFWLDWIETSSKWGSVEYFAGIFHATFNDIATMIEGGAPEHHYIRRQDPNDRNAKSSFILDVRKLTALFTTESHN